MYYVIRSYVVPIIYLCLHLIILAMSWPSRIVAPLEPSSSSWTLEEEIMVIRPDSNKLYEEGKLGDVMDKQNRRPLIIPKSLIRCNINGIFVRILICVTFKAEKTCCSIVDWCSAWQYGAPGFDSHCSKFERQACYLSL